MEVTLQENIPGRVKLAMEEGVLAYRVEFIGLMLDVPVILDVTILGCAEGRTKHILLLSCFREKTENWVPHGEDCPHQYTSKVCRIRRRPLHPGIRG